MPTSIQVHPALPQSEQRKYILFGITSTHDEDFGSGLLIDCIGQQNRKDTKFLYYTDTVQVESNKEIQVAF